MPVIIWINKEKKRITYKRLSTEFGRLMKSAKVETAPTYILLREDDMIYLDSKQFLKDFLLTFFISSKSDFFSEVKYKPY